MFVSSEEKDLSNIPLMYIAGDPWAYLQKKWRRLFQFVIRNITCHKITLFLTIIEPITVGMVQFKACL